MQSNCSLLIRPAHKVANVNNKYWNSLSGCGYRCDLWVTGCYPAMSPQKSGNKIGEVHIVPTPR